MNSEEAYQLLAEFKWKNGFVCRGCGNKEYYHGNKPYSRKCKTCKKIDTVTANTVFDKIRMPIDLCIGILEAMLNRKDASLSGLEEEVRQGGYTTDTKAIWKFVNKVYSRFIEKLYIYDKWAIVYIINIRKHDKVVYTIGEFKRQICYSATLYSSDYRFIPKVKEYIELHTKPTTNVYVCTIRSIKQLDLKPVSIEIKNREPLSMDTIQMAADLYEFIHYVSGKHVNSVFESVLNFYCFKKNGGTLKDMLHLLMKSPQKYTEVK